MNADPSHRSQRRRPDLSLNTAQASPPQPARQKSSVSSTRPSTRSAKKTTLLPSGLPTATASMAASPFDAATRRPPPGTAAAAAAADPETFLEMYTPVVDLPPELLSANDKENTHPGEGLDQAAARTSHRDSHDLSLPSRNVRDSLVSNMLLSLDQFSMGQLDTVDPVTPIARTAPAFDDQHLFSLTTTTTTAAASITDPHGHAASSRGASVSTVASAAASVPVARYAANNAYSSDYDTAADDNASRVSGSIARSRRSNSSSGFPASLGRLNSVRESSSAHRPGQPSTPRMMHSRGGKGSKSSSTSTNSIDTAGYVQVLGSQRWAHGIGGRSSSFDMGPRGGPASASGPAPIASATAAAAAVATGHYYQQQQQQQQQHQQFLLQQRPQQQQQQVLHPSSQQPWHIEFSNSFFNDAYDDAAPTPTVPGGPRKLTTAPSMPSIPSYQPLTGDSMPERVPERRRSVRSVRSAATGRQSHAAYNPAAAPPLPVFDLDLDSAPAPNVGYEKAKDPVPVQGHAQQQQQQQHHHHHPLRERPSFFRRVFGSIRDTVAGNEPAPPPVPAGIAHNSSAMGASSTSVDTSASRGAAQQGAAGQARSYGMPPSRDSQHSSHGAVLQKKPSGFFRRRKKSVSEVEAPPPLPSPIIRAQKQQQQQQQQQQPQVPQKLPPPAHPPVPLAHRPSVDSLSVQPPPPPQVDPRQPPPLKMPTRDARFVETATVSPATSLSRVMSPYLKDSPSGANGPSGANDPADSRLGLAVTLDNGTSPLREQDSNAGPDLSEGREEPEAQTTARTARGFSPDYEPPPTATIRAVGPVNGKTPAGAENDGSQRSPLVALPRMETPPSREPPAPPLQQNPVRSGSFLSDNSEGEESPRQTVARTLRASEAAEGRRGPLLGSKTDSLHLPLEGPGASGPGVAASSPASSSVISGVHGSGNNKSSGDLATQDRRPSQPIDEPEFVIGSPTEDDRQKALNIYEGNEDFIQKEKAAAWMGEEGPVRQRTLQAYMGFYDFHSQSVLNALRDVCSRLVLRAETQQVDRILVAFSKRWCDCNPNHGFKSIDVVHTICYSIMLLNTDLHLADIDSKMTRSQFVKNTMTTIHHTLAESAPEAFQRASILPGQSPLMGRRSADMVPDRGLAPPPSATLPRSGSSLGHHNDDDGGPLVNAPFDGPLRGWDAQMEIILKVIYASIRDEQLPLFGADASAAAAAGAAGGHAAPSTGSGGGGLSVMGMLKRSPSVLSKTPSEGQSSTRGRVPEPTGRSGSRWASKSRSRARLPTPGISNGFSSSRTSFEDGNSVWSPTGSSATWSRQSLGRTQASMSMESFGSAWGRSEYQQSIGFANALSQAIIREDTLGSVQSLGSDGASSVGGGGGGGPGSMEAAGLSSSLMEDESLELAGPPWVKEGMVVHKHHLDGLDKRAKDRNWTEVFAVVQKGTMSLFSFTPNKSTRGKSRGRHQAPLPGKGAVVGGGNWQDNATNLGTFALKQTLASALPPPGYSRQRPHVWALSLPTGAVHLFQVGTPEICKEFVNTANYWSARLSTHPLVGGVSNMEYGWSDAIVHNVLVTAINNGSSPALGSGVAASSAASVRSMGSGRNGSAYPPSASRPGSAAAAAVAAATAMAGRASLQSRGRSGSFRSGSMDFGHARSGSASSGRAAAGGGSSSGGGGGLHSAGMGMGMGVGKLPGDRVHIAEWVPPTQSLRASTATEAQQRQTLLAYVESIEAELQAHNALRSPMLLAFTPRGSNANKAMANWERKSAYLLREIVKYRTYADSLAAAARRRADIYREREIARRAARGEASLASSASGSEASDADDDDDDDDNVDADETLRP